MDVTPIVNRLRERLTDFADVGGAAELDAAIAALPAVPVAFAFPLAEGGEAPQWAGQPSQRVTQTFGVVLVVQNLADPAGGAAQSDLAEKRRQVRAALRGWEPVEGSGDACQFVSGRLLRFEAGRLWWVDEFMVMCDDWS